MVSYVISGEDDFSVLPAPVKPVAAAVGAAGATRRNSK